MSEEKTTMEKEKSILPDITNIKTQETFTLPSKGLVYDKTDSIGSSITLRRMTTKEDKLRMRNESEDKIRRDILQACILDEGVNAGKLKLADANFLLFKLRVISLLDDTYKLQLVCPNCGSEFIHEVNLSDLNINYMTKEKTKNMEIILPLSQVKIGLKLPCLDDIIKMSDKLKEYFNKFPNVDRSEAIYTTSAMLYIKDVNGQTMMNEELEDWLDNMDIIDNRAFRKKLSEIDDIFGINTDMKCECPNCNSVVDHGLPITGELFNPSL